MTGSQCLTVMKIDRILDTKFFLLRSTRYAHPSAGDDRISSDDPPLFDDSNFYFAHLGCLDGCAKPSPSRTYDKDIGLRIPPLQH